MIGTHIGNYRIVTELGSGAMGEVYFAEHSVMGRRAAVKVIRAELSHNAEMVERFANEARQVNRIGHPNIVEITDFGQVASRYYIMMELLEGETLEERLERTPRLPLEAALRITLQITAALEAAHQLGVVHRDLKPENIFLTTRGGTRDFVKVLDFGIAKLMGGAHSAAATGTVPGMLLGTPHYMSPEQCHGAEQLDHRSDVYALGVIVYRMLTGELPFDGDTLLAVLYAHANVAPRAPRELCPDLTPHMEAVLLKALSKAPEDRFQNMADFRAALEGKPLAAPAKTAAAKVEPQPGAAEAQKKPAAATARAAAREELAAARPARTTEMGANRADGSAMRSVTRNGEASPIRAARRAADVGVHRPGSRAAEVVTTRAGELLKQLGVSGAGEAAAPRAAVQLKVAPRRGEISTTLHAQAPASPQTIEASGGMTDPAPAEPHVEQAREADAKQGQRVGNRLARILVERINKNRLLLPAMPGAARECLKLVDDPSGGVVRLAAAIGRDPVIAPLVLKRARSALLGTHTPVRTIEQAIARLGSRQLRSILLDLCTRRLFESRNPAIRRATRGLWEHSLAVAVLSRAIARRRRDVDPEAAYLAGLLHDVGKPVAASLLLEAERTTDAKPDEWLSRDAWLDVIQECHREVGTALARNWELQDDVVFAIARSQRYSVDGPGSISSVVCFANALVKSQGIYTGAFDLDAVQALIREGLELFKIDREMLDGLLSELHDVAAADAVPAD